MASKIFLFGFFVLTTFAASVSAGENCIKSGNICQNNDVCCNPNDNCYIQSLANHISRCGGDGLLGASCSNGIECSRIIGGTCENGICVCQSGHIKRDRHMCHPIVKDPRVTYYRKK